VIGDLFADDTFLGEPPVHRLEAACGVDRTADGGNRSCPGIAHVADDRAADMNTDADALGFGQIVLEIFVEFFQARSHPGARN
jgi:hypothetical protein